MAILLLVIIYLAFIGIGLPAAVLGAAWPVIHTSFGASIETAGYISLIITVGTVISSLYTARITKRLGTGLVTAFSVGLTATSLIGLSQSPSVLWFFVLSLPLGLGAGAVDAALNSYVANHYKAKHMNWLHCFWGVGAMFGPIILSYTLTAGNTWRTGYFIIALILLGLAVMLFLTIPLWNRLKSIHQPHHDEVLSDIKESNWTALQIKGVKFSLLIFLFYCAGEISVGLWGSSFLVSIKHISVAKAAQWVGFYFAGITVGRLLAGFIAIKISSKSLIRLGQIIALFGALLILLPNPIFTLVGFIIIGLGFAPIFPTLIHETPSRFGKFNSSRIIGLQIAIAYVGSSIMPPLIGATAGKFGMGVFVFFILACIAGMIITSELLNIRRPAIQQASNE